jgi:CBS domain-containing protein
MKVARDVMDTNPLAVSPQTRVQDLAARLNQIHGDGACVVDAGKLVGVVTTMDLLYKEKRLHLPTFFYLLDVVVPLENPFRTQREVEKITAATAADIMTPDPYTVPPDAPLDAVAARMIDDHLTLVPVVDGGRLVGVVTKPAMLREAFGLRQA